MLAYNKFTLAYVSVSAVRWTTHWG